MYIGKRITLDGFRGTIKYIGPLKQTDATWLGVEWDDPSRGKHSGVYKDDTIFDCRPGAGSFLKLSKAKFESTRSFAEAIKAKYYETQSGSEEEVATVVGISRPIQSVGFDKIRVRYSDVSKVTELYLANLGVESLSLDDIPITQLAQVTTIDLSWNLLSDFAALLTLCQGLSSLLSLKVEGNRFSPPTIDDHGIVTTVETITDLGLSLTFLSWSQVLGSISKSFPKARSLQLAYNDLGDIVSETTNDNVCELNLLGNCVKNIHGILETFPCLERLDLSQNKVSQIPPRASIREVQACIKHINLANNPLENLSDVSNLACYPALQSFQYTLVFDDERDELSRLTIIKHLPQLKIVNRTPVTQQERQDAARIGLVEAPSTQSISRNFVSLTLVAAASSLEKKVPRTQTVKQLKATYARFAGQRPTQIAALLYRHHHDDGAGADEREVRLDDDLAQLSYYDVVDGGRISRAD